MSAKKLSSISCWLKASMYLAPILGLGGCSDYLTRSDTITSRAGDAQAWNKVIHVSDPWPPYVMNTQIAGDGQRTTGVIQRYSTAGTPAEATQGSSSPGNSLARRGSDGGSGAANGPPQ